jgi:alkylhydroperoxidase family enzyme
MCKARRQSDALDAGGSETMYEQIDRYGTADLLTDRHKAALRYVDALIWTPAAIASDVAAGVRTHFSEAEAFELTVDVMHNAANKIAVSLAADAP